MAGPLVRFVLTTVGVGALVLCLAWALRRRGVMGAAPGELRVTERQVTGKDQSLLVVEAGGRRLLVGQTPGGMATLAELGPCTSDLGDEGDGACDPDASAAARPVVAAAARPGASASAAPPTSIIAWVREVRSRRRGGDQQRAGAPDLAEESVTDLADDDGTLAAGDEVFPAAARGTQDQTGALGVGGIPGDGLALGDGAGGAPADGAVFAEVLASAGRDPEVAPQVTDAAVGVSGAEATPAASGAEPDVAVDLDEVTPVVSGAEATPVVSGAEATPVVQAAERAPGVTGVAAPPATVAAEPVRAPSVQSLDDDALTRVLMELDARTVLTAIKGAPTSFAERVGTCFVAGDETRRQALVNCAMNMRDVALSPQEVRAARREVAQAARRLIEWGEISPSPSPGSAEAFSKVYARVGGGRV